MIIERSLIINPRYVWRKLEKFEKALDDYNFILSIHPDNQKALINRAFCLAKLENYGEAVNDYSRVIELEPNNIHAL